MDTAVTASLTHLRDQALLAGLPDTVLQEVAAACTCRRYRAGQTIVERDDDGSDLYLILSGQVRAVALSPGGREVSFRDLAAGASFGEIAALDGLPRSATVQALGEVVIARIAATDLARLMRTHWPICERVLRNLTASVRDLTDRVYTLSTQGVRQRLAGELLRLGLASHPSDGTATLEPAPRHADLASRIGSYREQVTRELADLERQGLIQRADKALVVPDLARLASFAAGAEGSSQRP